MRISNKSQLLVVLLAASFLALGAVEEANSEKAELKFTTSDEPAEGATVREGEGTTAIQTHVGAAEEPNSEKGELKFTISEKPEVWDASWQQPMQIEKPAHVAVFQLDNLRIWKSPWVKRVARVRDTTLERVAFTGEGSLTQPYEFLLSMDNTGPNRMQFWIYAASEQEAREMAEALIDGAKSLAYAYVRRDEARLEDYRKKITDIENEIPKLEEKKQAAEAQFAECKKTTYYRNKDDAQRSILEWNNLLSAAEVDIIGIQAKLNMVKELRKKEQEKVEADELFWFLFRMRMAEEVELAGALARKNAALSFRDKALKFLDLAEKLDSLSAQLFVKQDNLSGYQKSIANLEGRLPQLRADVRPVEVVDNEVKIHPLK